MEEVSAEEAPQPMTVYEFLAAEAPIYRGGADGPYKQLYYDCSKLIATFTIADLRHDFGYELNAISGGKTLGNWLCDDICSAFYVKNNAKYTELLEYVSTTYVKITSDTTAKSVMKILFNEFYDKVITTNRAIWGPNYYGARYDDSGSEPLLYGDVFKASNTHKKITGNSGADTAIMVDALYGNPVDHIFSIYKDTDRSYYLYNYASALDAASKPIGSVHDYMYTHIQNPIPSPQIPPTYTGFGSLVKINKFTYEPTVFKYNAWTTSVSISVNTPSPPTVFTEAFNPSKEASVDNLALVPVRSGMKKEHIDAAVAAKANKFILKPTIANHIIKSLGDRLQTFTMLDSELVNYGQITDLRTGVIDPKDLFHFKDKHLIQFTNDILACMNNYLMQKNTVFTGLQKVIYYEYAPREPLTRAKVLAFFSDPKRSELITKMLLNIFSKNNVNINSADKILNSIYLACAARDATEYCRRHLLFSHFIGRIPSAEELSGVITEENFQSFVPLMADNIEASIIEKNFPIEISKEEVEREINATRANISFIELEVQMNPGGFGTPDKLDELYAKFLAQVTSLESTLRLQGIIENTELLSNCIIYLLNYKPINGIIFNDLTKVYDNLININTDSRRLPFTVLLAAFQTPFIPEPPLYVQMRNMYTSISQYIRHTPITSLEEANTVLSWVINAMQTYAGIDHTNEKVINANNIAFKYYKMAIYIKLINTNNADIKPLVRAILASNRLDTVNLAGKKQSIKPTQSKKTLARPVHMKVGKVAPKKSKSFESRILIKIKEKVINGERTYTAIQQSDLIAIINAQLSGQKGGSRSRAKRTLEDLCMKKIEFMFNVLNHPNNKYALGTLVYLSNILSLIVEDYNVLKKSRSKPHLLQTSIFSSRSLSTISEENENESQIGGSRGRLHTLQSSTILVQGKGAAPIKATLEWVPERPGSRVMVARPITQSKRILLRTQTQLSPKSKRVTLRSSKIESQLVKTPVTVISRKEGLSRVEKQLIAFFWLGVTRHPEQIELEQGIYSELLPIEGISAVGNIINQIFWQPFFLYSKSSYESIMQVFESKYLPTIKQTQSAPQVRRKSLTRQTRKKKASSA